MLPVLTNMIRRILLDALLQFLLDTLGEERIVFGSDYCGGLGPLEKALPVIADQPNPAHIKSVTERNSRRLLKL